MGALMVDIKFHDIGIRILIAVSTFNPITFRCLFGILAVGDDF